MSIVSTQTLSDEWEQHIDIVCEIKNDFVKKLKAFDRQLNEGLENEKLDNEDLKKKYDEGRTARASLRKEKAQLHKIVDALKADNENKNNEIAEL